MRRRRRRGQTWYEETRDLRRDAQAAAIDGKHKRAAQMFQRLAQRCESVDDYNGAQHYRDLAAELEKRAELPPAREVKRAPRPPEEPPASMDHMPDWQKEW